MKEIIHLMLKDRGDGEAGHLGSVVPPESFPARNYQEMQNKINKLWRQWRAATPHADTDDEFVNWLVSEKGFERGPASSTVVLDYKG